LPEAIGSKAHGAKRDERPPTKQAWCDIPNCLTRRGERVELPGGQWDYVKLRGFGEVAIQGKDESVVGHVCQKHYVEILNKAGKDQLSCVREQGITSPQESLGYKPTTPPNLVDHLRAIEDQLADQWAAEHDAAD
jgi:hypothetical protein